MVAGFAWSQEPIQYTLRFPDPANHHIDVEAIYPTGGKPTVDLKMAVWTAYVIREYSQNVETLTSPHGARKIRKNRWRINTGGGPTVTVRYRLYAESMHVQDNYVDTDFALINGQPTFLTLVEDDSRPHEVRLELPPKWRIVTTPLPKVRLDCYRARDYEQLVDSPIIAGNPSIYTFNSAGKIHYLVNVAEKETWKRVPLDLEKMIAAQKNIWGSLPYDRYFFFNILSGKGGGMEHSDSTVLMAAPDAMKQRATYVAWLNLVSHEFFHVWNVKRLRPREFTPGEYETEQYTESLGIAEGFTSYYGPLTLRRAGVISEEEYLEPLSRLIDSLQRTEGRKVQSLAESSYDTWIKFYRPIKNSAATTISYYTKGAIVGLLLDARIRAATGGKKSLDDVMRLALERYPPERGYTLDEFCDTASEVAGVKLDPWFHRWFHSTEELDYSEAEKIFRWRIAPDSKGDWRVTKR